MLYYHINTSLCLHDIGFAKAISVSYTKANFVDSDNSFCPGEFHRHCYFVSFCQGSALACIAVCHFTFRQLQSCTYQYLIVIVSPKALLYIYGNTCVYCRHFQKYHFFCIRHIPVKSLCTDTTFVLQNV